MKKNSAIVIRCTTCFITVICVLLSCACSDKPNQPTEREDITYEAFITDSVGKVIPAYSAVEINNLDASRFKLDENNRMYYDDTSVKTFTGIDVSMYQGDIDWQAVRADNIDFVILRIGGRGYGEKGIMYADDNFEVNYKQATEAGLMVGVYFFSQAVTVEEAKEEADYVLRTVDSRKLAYPIVFDWEVIKNEPGARTAGISNASVTACANKFCETIANAGYTPVIYFNRSLGYDQYILSDINHYDFWLAEYSATPNFYYNFSMWQYTTQGTVAGIEGSVDMNICFSDFTAETTSQETLPTIN